MAALPSRGRSSMAEPQPSKLVMRVRFPSPAPPRNPRSTPLPVLASSRVRKPQSVGVPVACPMEDPRPEPVPVATHLMAEDPVLGMVHDGQRWWIQHKPGGERLGSPLDDDQPRDSDVADLARHHDPDAVRVHIAGIHAIGSLGAAHYLAANLADLYAETAGKSVSLVVRCQYRGLAITSTELAAGPYTW
jgi:hypothetical protein